MAGSDFSDYGLSELNIDTDSPCFIGGDIGRGSPEKSAHGHFYSGSTPRDTLQQDRGVYSVRTPKTSGDDISMDIKRHSETWKMREEEEKIDRELTSERKQRKRTDRIQRQFDEVERRNRELEKERAGIVDELRTKEKHEHSLLCENALLLGELRKAEEERRGLATVTNRAAKAERENRQLRAAIHRMRADHENEREMFIRRHEAKITELYREYCRRGEKREEDIELRTRKACEGRVRDIARRIKEHYEEKYRAAVGQLRGTPNRSTDPREGQSRASTSFSRRWL
ncbi:MAG: uncharacterized protein A8A55_0581 [Amphiamblys sp. WSBS2006]|nr:MAG: uncharacterized protein A8A55_0581 [Amphiamblys sp. WSBS2006]